MKKIGIISGMGAAAGSYFYDLLIKEYQKNGAVSDSDFPEIVLHNVSSIGMDETGICNELVVKEDLLKSVSMLNSLYVDVIVIACNTVHIYHEYLQSNSIAKILNMIEIAVDSCSASDKVGVISSSCTKKYCLYDSFLSKKNIETIKTTENQQEIIDALISRAISGDIVMEDKLSLQPSICSDLEQMK